MTERDNVVINLCDRPISVLQKSLNDYKEKHFQIGSYSCANYFKNIVKLVDKFCDCKFDLVIPVFPEHMLYILEDNNFKKLLDCSSMIVVNDFGMLEYFSDKKRLRMGRMFFRDYRDKRYQDYDYGEYYGKAQELLSFVKNCGFSVSAIENDIITKKYNLSIDKDFVKYYHYPYRQISAGHICEYSAIGVGIEDKFKPDDNCDMQCAKVFIKSSAGYIKIGKNIYDIIDESYLSVVSQNDYIIYTPRWEL